LGRLSWFWGDIDNPGLCVESNSGLPLHTCSGAGGHVSRRKIILSVAISSFALFGVGCIWRKKGQQDVTSWMITPFRALNFTEHDILSNIQEENLIRRGGSGKVYRIHVGSQKSAAKGGDEAGGNSSTVDKEFEVEVVSLGGLRHGNIVDLLCCISGDDTKLLVYEYMENGSLDRWLHRRRRRGPPLGWPTRLRITVDVDRGLSYMHRGFTRPVIHRDVKCSNILLDHGFRAKIADFGLARILARAGESEPASGICETFGYIAPGPR